MKTKNPEGAFWYDLFVCCQQIWTIINVKGSPSGKRKVTVDVNMGYKKIGRKEKRVIKWIKIYKLLLLF